MLNNSEERFSELERRVKHLEMLLRPGGFKNHCIELDLCCSDIVREWFKYHDMLHIKSIGVEMGGYYSIGAFRMAVCRMSYSGELIHVGHGIYKYNGLFKPKTSNYYRGVTPEVSAEIKQDTTHSHNELARKLGVSSHTVRKLGHKSPYKFTGVGARSK